MLLQGEEATVAVAETAGLTGLSGAFTLLKTGIMEAMEASIAFMATPIGMAISAIAVAVGIAIGSFALYQQHQAELTDNAKKLKEAVDLANDAISHGDIKSAGKELGDIKDQQDKLESLIATKKKLDDMPESNFFDKVGGASKAQSIALVQKQIDDLTDSYTKQGLTVDEQTGKIEQYVNAQHAMADAQDVEKIKEKTKAQIEDRMNLESAQEEYNSFISTSQDLYSEYQNLSSQENLSAEQKQRLGEVCDELQGRFTDLNVSVDENGVAHINNTPLIEDNISYLTSEGMTVDTLTSIRMADSKACSEWSVNNQNMTYAEVCANIENYKTEIDALRKLAEARSAQKSDPNFFGPFPENDGIDDQIKDLTDKENGALAVKNRIDEIYGSIKPPTRGGGGYSTSGVDAEPKASKAKGGSTGKSEAEKEAEKAQKEAEKYAEQISNTKVDIKTDRYFSLNGVLEKINGQLTLNKTLQDATTGEEHYKAIEQEIELYKQKQDALTKLNAEQEKEKNEIKDYLSQYSFYFDATTGEMLNSQTRLQELQDGVNAMGGNTKEELDKKKEAVEWVKKLQEETKKYADLVNSKIPSVTDQFNELNNTIRKTEESMLSTVRDEIVDGLKKELEKKKEEELEANEKAKKTAIDELEEKEKKIKKEIADLEDSTQDKQKKLDKLRTELMRWQKDDSPLAKKKIADLNEKISSLEKDVKKDDLNKQLSDIDEEKKAKSDYYSDLKDETEKSYKSQLEDKALYEKADKMLTAKSMDEIVELLKTYSTSYKDIGTLLGKNMGDAIKAQVEESIKSLEDLTGQKITKGTGTGTTGGTGSDSGSSSSSSEDAKAKKNWWELGKGDNVWIRQPKTPVYTDSSGTDVTGQTWWDSGVGSEDKLYIVDSKNGLSELSRDKSGNGVVGWIPRSLLAQYDTGGKTPANMNPNGELGILHPNEKILNSDMTKRFEALEDMAMAFKPMLSGISNMANIIQASKQLISGLSSSEESSVEIQNTYNVTNNTPFDTRYSETI
jgi:hypothetical protein